MSNQMRRNCFCCEKPLFSSTGGLDHEFFSPPMDATVWQTSGNFGSKVYDNVWGEGPKLEMYICDNCLKTKASSVYQYTMKPREIDSVEVFSPQG